MNRYSTNWLYDHTNVDIYHQNKKTRLENPMKRENHSSSTQHAHSRHPHHRQHVSNETDEQPQPLRFSRIHIYFFVFRRIFWIELHHHILHQLILIQIDQISNENELVLIINSNK